MDGWVAGVFLAVYAGMLLGRVPRLQLDRTGVALLGAIVLVVAGAVTLEAAVAAVDGPTMALLFGFMVLSAQLRQSGFFARVTWWLASRDTGPALLLGALVFGAGALSAVFSNDIVCLAATPVLAEACRRRGLDPVPYLVGLACAANVGSTATLVGNPQNMLIGEATAERIKCTIGTARMPDDGRGMTMSIRGRDLLNGVPKELEITQGQIAEALSETVQTICEAVMIALETTPPDLAADIVDRGVMLTGGGALLGDLDLALREQTGLIITVADQSLNCVALGTGKALEYEKQLRHAIDYES